MYKEGVSYGNVSIPCHGITGKECIEETSVLHINYLLYIYIWYHFNRFVSVCYVRKSYVDKVITIQKNKWLSLF